MRKVFALMMFAVMMEGCCECVKPERVVEKLPEAVSLEEQVSRLNEKAAGLPRVMAKGTFVIRYVDKDGNQKQDSLDGLLLMRQRYGKEGAADPADIYLRGTFIAAKPHFYAAKNQQKWWFVEEEKDGWMGDVAGPAAVSGDRDGDLMRADLLVEVLAITEIQRHAGEAIAMKVHDRNGMNDIEILRLRENGTAWVKREIFVDRRSGDVSEVMLADPSGRLVVRSELKDYKPVTYKEGDAAPAPMKDLAGAMFPHDILVIYPAQKLSVHFTVTHAELQAVGNDDVFETPDFAELGIRKIENRK